MTIFDRIRLHNFHPIKDGFTYDRLLDEQGVADLNDKDWLVRTLAVRDLVRIGSDVTDYLLQVLNDDNPHVRQVAAMVSGILRTNEAVSHLEKILAEDPDEVVRAQVAISLGQIGNQSSLETLERAKESGSHYSIVKR